jgi:hypothetical protein
MELKIHTAEDVRQFVRFFSKSSLTFIPTDEFSSLLYEAIGSGTIFPSWLNNYTLQKCLNEMLVKYPEDQNLKRFIKGYSNSEADELRKPTEHFKTFCGSEGLTQDGLLTKKMALNFIMYQIDLRKITVIDGSIYMNEYLNTLFNTNLYKIRSDELLDLIDTLFI